MDLDGSAIEETGRSMWVLKGMRRLLQVVGGDHMFGHEKFLCGGGTCATKILLLLRLRNENQYGDWLSCMCVRWGFDSGLVFFEWILSSIISILEP